MLEHLCNLQEHYKKADLHIHTTASDGIFSPQEIIHMAEKARLSYIAITDHDTVEGLADLTETSPNLVVIPGIEFTSDVKDREVHILGYNIDIRNVGLLEKLAVITDYRSKRIKEIINRINHLGYNLSSEQLPVNCNSLGRSHISTILVQKGYFANIQEVLDKLLSTGKPAYIPHYPQKPADIINLIKQADGIPVLAHPKLIKSDTLVNSVINSGISGIEVYHPSHNEEDIAKYKALAEKHGLIITGGSDFHGIPKRFPPELGIYYVQASIMQFLVRRKELHF